MKKEWKEIDFDCCPECGDVVEIETDCKQDGHFFDGDPVRCVNKCDISGQFSIDEETGGWINFG